MNSTNTHTHTTHIRNIAISLSVLFLLCIALTVHATLLVTVQADKNTIMENEIGGLKVKILNDSNLDEKNIQVRIEGSNGQVVFPENGDAPSLVKSIDIIRPFETKELQIRIKGGKLSTEAATIFAYYGTTLPLRYVAGTFITTKAGKVTTAITSSKKSTADGETAIIDWSITNHTGTQLHTIAAEALAPQRFTVQDPPFTQEFLADNATAAQKFTILAPLEAQGPQVLTLAYGYFDETGPHYFEKTFSVSFEKDNRLVLGIIGVLVLIVAVFLYSQKTQGDKSIKGSK